MLKNFITTSLNEKYNPLNIFLNKKFEDWLIKSGYFKKIDDDKIEIPFVEISQQKNHYYLDIQEFYSDGDSLLSSNSAINAYAHQNGCHLHLVESYRYNGVIRYVFIKIN